MFFVWFATTIVLLTSVKLALILISPEAILTLASSSCINFNAFFLRVSQKSSEPRLFKINVLLPVKPPCRVSQAPSVDVTSSIKEFCKSSTCWISEVKFEVSFSFPSKACSPLSLSNFTWLQRRSKISLTDLSAIFVWSIQQRIVGRMCHFWLLGGEGKDRMERCMVSASNCKQMQVCRWACENKFLPK